MDGRYTSEHIPWEFEEDVFVPMPWIPEGSLISKNRFYEVRREQRPKSYSPPPTPPVDHDVPPLDALPFPAIVPSSAEGPTLKRAVSFHPGGSQRLRREALVIDGKVTIDAGFKLRSHSCESIVLSSCEPNNMDPLSRQLDTGHQSGLERLKNSMLRLMKAQSQRRCSTAVKEGKHSELSPPTAAPNKKPSPGHELLAVRRGLSVPSTLKLESQHLVPRVSPYRSDIPVHGFPSVATPLSETTRFLPTPAADKRKSIDIKDMCTNLRYLVSPVISKSAGEEIVSSHNCYPTTAPMDASDGAVNGTPKAPVEDWNFASELEGVYGDDPFSYFDTQERMPSFIRPLSVILDLVAENTEVRRSSSSSATSISTFPEPPTDNPTVPPIPYITISEGGPVAEYSSAETRLSFSSSTTASDENLMDSGDGDEMHTHTIVSSADTSPRSSEDKDEPLAIRRLTLLARSSTLIPKVGDFSSTENLPSSPSNCSISLAQETLKPVTKIVRFASETDEHLYPTVPGIVYSPSTRQRPRSSSVPPPQKGSLRNQTFLRQDECRDGRLSRSQPITFPSRIPKKRTFTKIGLPSRHITTDQRDTEAQVLDGRDPLTPTGLENENEARKQPSSRIPVPGIKTPPALRGNVHDEKRGTGHNSRLYVSLKQPSRTPTPQSASLQQKTQLATSWSTTLRQYVKGGGPKGQVSHPPPLKFLPVSPVRTKDDRKSSLPVKKASFFRDGGDNDAEDSAVGSMDKTGGISYIAPPKVRAPSQLRGRARGERKGVSTAGAKTLRPTQIRNLIDRLTA